jgi:diguanylate cyclase (GGDEF)-like protein
LPGDVRHRLTAVGFLLAATLALVAPVSRASEPSMAPWRALNAPRFEAVQPQGNPLEGPIRAITEDADGLVWAVSGATLWRWDGYRTVKAELRADAAKGLEESPVMQTVRADAEGELWAGTARGVYRVDRQWPSRPALVPVPLAGAPPSVLFIDFPPVSDDRVRAYFGTVGAVLALRRGGGVESMPIPEAGPNRLHALHVDPAGRLWAGTTLGLFRWSADAPGPRWVPEPLPVPSARIAALGSDAAGRLWIGTAHHGLLSLEPDGATKAWGWPEGTQPSPRIFALAQVRAGELWVGSFGQGVWSLDTASGAWAPMRHDRSRSGSLDDDNVWAIFADSRGLGWVGTATGLQWRSADQRRLLNLPLAPEPDAPASRVRAHGMAASGRGVWWGTNTGRLRHLGITPLPADEAALLALWGRGEPVAGAMELIAPMGAGRWVLGSDWQTVLAEPSRGRVRPLQPPARGSATYTSSAVGWGGAWWLAGPDGLWRLPLAVTGEPRLDEASNLLADTRGERRVASLLPTAETLWVGTWSGLARLDRGETTVQPVSVAALDGHFLTTMLADPHGRLWVGTSAGGLFHAPMDRAGESGAWSRIDEAGGLPGNSVAALLLDEDGFVWASTSRGLARIDPRNGGVRAFHADQGAAAAPYGRRSGAVLPGGELVFGGTDAVTVVLPRGEGDPAPRPLPALVLTDIATSEDEPLPLFDPVTSDTRARLRVPSGVSRIALEFAAPVYVGADGLRYRYRLQGWDERWSEVDAAHRVASFTRIAPGRYRFDVEVAEAAGPWQDGGLSIDVDVVPAWHQHRGFHILLVIALATIVAGAVHWRARVLRERAHALERMVEARTAALAMANAELAQAHRAVEEASLTDPLTGLHNRRFLWRHIDADVALALRSRHGDVAAREPSDLLFFLVDVDHFKRINDQHGHAIGDLVLVEMGRRLRTVFRESDHVVRWGGEEFLGVARGAQRQDGPRVAERIRVAVAESPFALPGGGQLAVRCSVGFAALPLVAADRHAFGWEDTVAIADEALYEAKSAGRDGWAGFEESGEPIDPQDLAALRLRSIRATTVRGLLLRRSGA